MLDLCFIIGQIKIVFVFTGKKGKKRRKKRYVFIDVFREEKVMIFYFLFNMLEWK